MYKSRYSSLQWFVYMMMLDLYFGALSEVKHVCLGLCVATVEIIFTEHPHTMFTEDPLEFS